MNYQSNERREDYLDRPHDNLPQLPPCTTLSSQSTNSNPLAFDVKTGVFYRLTNGGWQSAD